MKLDKVVFINNLPTLDLHGYDRQTAVVAISDFIRDNIKLKNEILVCFRRQDTKKNIKYSFLNEKIEVQNHSNNLIFRIVVARQYKFCCWVLA